MKRFIVWAVFIAWATAVSGPSVLAAEKVKLRLQCVYPESAQMGQATKFFVQRVAELTGGNVEIAVFWPDQLVKTAEAFDALGKGLIDVYSGSMLYFAGTIPEVNCEWIPFGWADPKEALDIYQNHGWLDLMRQATLKHGVRYVAPLSVASMGLITKFPVNSLQDMKGRMIRAVGMEAKIIDALGAAPVSISGAEQYMALQRGTVQGTDYPFYTIGEYKFYEVCEYIIRPALHTPGIIELLINQKVYAGLSEDYRKAIDKAGWDAFLRTVELSQVWDEEAYKFCKEKNVTIIDLKPEVVTEFRKATLPLWEQVGKRTEISGKMVSNLKAYLKGKGVKLD